MYLTSDNKIKNLIIIGDRVLIKPIKPDEKTKSGLFLPPGVIDQEKVTKGYVMRTGPGYAIPGNFDDEPWKTEDEAVKYIPLQAKEGDLAIFLINNAIEIKYEEEKYFIVPHNAILMLERVEDLD
jgi:co-chaperonin GroES (HSP10)